MNPIYHCLNQSLPAAGDVFSQQKQDNTQLNQAVYEASYSGAILIIEVKMLYIIT